MKRALLVSLAFHSIVLAAVLFVNFFWGGLPGVSPYTYVGAIEIRNNSGQVFSAVKKGKRNRNFVQHAKIPTAISQEKMLTDTQTGAARPIDAQPQHSSGSDRVTSIEDLAGTSDKPAQNYARDLLRTNEIPAYPRWARAKGYQGRVIIRIEVDATGELKQSAVERSSGYPELDEYVLEKVRQWKFPQPPVPATLRLLLPFSFQLEQ